MTSHPSCCACRLSFILDKMSQSLVLVASSPPNLFSMLFQKFESLIISPQVKFYLKVRTLELELFHS